MISGINSQSSNYVSQITPNGGEENRVEKTDEVVATDRVSLLSQQIQNGEYKVDTEKTANVIAEELSR